MAAHMVVRLRTEKQMDTTVERISKLLNHAENAGTEAEADAFMDRAQQLATLHSIDLARARHATSARERSTPIQRSITIGIRGAKGLRTQTDLFLGIAIANDVKCVTTGNGAAVLAHGFAEDIDVAEAMFNSLLVQMASAAETFKRSGAWRDELVHVDARWRGVEWIPPQWKPQTWLTARLNFQDAYANRIAERLHQTKVREEKRQIAAEPSNMSSGAELVLASKKKAVEDLFAPVLESCRGNWRGGTTGAWSESGWSAGIAAADDARLGQSAEIGGARRAINA